MSPRRIQMTRSRPWRADHPDAVIVDRRTKWGNPFKPVSRGGPWVVVDVNGVEYPVLDGSGHGAINRSVDLFHIDITEWNSGQVTVEEIRAELAGKDLACWCPLDQPCHADVLLDLANRADS